MVATGTAPRIVGGIFSKGSRKVKVRYQASPVSVLCLFDLAPGLSLAEFKNQLPPYLFFNL